MKKLFLIFGIIISLGIQAQFSLLFSSGEATPVGPYPVPNSGYTGTTDWDNSGGIPDGWSGSGDASFSVRNIPPMSGNNFYIMVNSTIAQVKTETTPDLVGFPSTGRLYFEYLSGGVFDVYIRDVSGYGSSIFTGAFSSAKKTETIPYTLANPLLGIKIIVSGVISMDLDRIAVLDPL